MIKSGKLKVGIKRELLESLAVFDFAEQKFYASHFPFHVSLFMVILIKRIINKRNTK